jgi:hypothetical protein
MGAGWSTGGERQVLAMWRWKRPVYTILGSAFTVPVVKAKRIKYVHVMYVHVMGGGTGDVGSAYPGSG